MEQLILKMAKYIYKNYGLEKIYDLTKDLNKKRQNEIEKGALVQRLTMLAEDVSSKYEYIDKDYASRIVLSKNFLYFFNLMGIKENGKEIYFENEKDIYALVNRKILFSDIEEKVIDDYFKLINEFAKQSIEIISPNKEEFILLLDGKTFKNAIRNAKPNTFFYYYNVFKENKGNKIQAAKSLIKRTRRFININLDDFNYKEINYVLTDIRSILIRIEEFDAKLGKMIDNAVIDSYATRPFLNALMDKMLEISKDTEYDLEKTFNEAKKTLEVSYDKNKIIITFDKNVKEITKEYKTVIENILKDRKELSTVEIYLPKKLERIYPNVFEKLENTHFYLTGNNLKYIGKKAFKDCPGSFLFGSKQNNLKLIEEAAFQSIPSLNKLSEETKGIKIDLNIFPNNCKVEKNAFNNKSILTSDFYKLSKILNLDLSDTDSLKLKAGAYSISTGKMFLIDEIDKIYSAKINENGLTKNQLIFLVTFARNVDVEEFNFIVETMKININYNNMGNIIPEINKVEDFNENCLEFLNYIQIYPDKILRKAIIKEQEFDRLIKNPKYLMVLEKNENLTNIQCNKLIHAFELMGKLDYIENPLILKYLNN